MNRLDEQNIQIQERWDDICDSEISNLDAQLLDEEISDEQLSKYLKEMNRFDKENALDIEHQEQYYYEFQDYKDEYGHNPKVYNKAFYISWIIFLVILEIPTNYTTIEQFLHKPLISMLITIAIGSLLVFIAHSHGSFFKQITFIKTTANSEDNHNVTSRTMRYAIAISGFVGLIIVMYGLYYARMQYFNAISGVSVDDPFSDGSGTDLVTATIFTKVGILMLANFAIYALGVIGSYIVHDTIPGYQESYFKDQKYKKKLLKKYAIMLEELDRIIKKVRKKSRRSKRNPKNENSNDESTSSKKVEDNE